MYGENICAFPYILGALPQIWLCTRSHLNFLIYEENFVFFFISVDLVTYRYQKIFLLPFKIGMLENLLAFIWPPACVTNSFRDNPATLATKFGRWEKIFSSFCSAEFFYTIWSKWDYIKKKKNVKISTFFPWQLNFPLHGLDEKLCQELASLVQYISKRAVATPYILPRCRTQVLFQGVLIIDWFTHCHLYSFSGGNNWKSMRKRGEHTHGLFRLFLKN
jgi:hypothetical protein